MRESNRLCQRCCGPLRRAFIVTAAALLVARALLAAPALLVARALLVAPALLAAPALLVARALLVAPALLAAPIPLVAPALPIVPAATTNAARAETGFELESRSLMQGPARTGTFYRNGLILGTGGGIVIFSPAGSIADRVFLPVEGEPQDITVRDDMAYVAAGRGGLITVDISDPHAPRTVSRHRARLAARCRTVRSHLFVAGYHKNLYTFDLTEAGEPRLASERQLPEPAVALLSRGELLIIVCGSAVDVDSVRSDGTLQNLERIIPPSPPVRGIIDDDTLYLVVKSGDVLRWSLARPGNAAQLPPLQCGRVVDCAVENGRGLLLTASHTIVPFSVRQRGSSEEPTGSGGSTVRKQGGEARSPGETRIGDPLHARYDGKTGGGRGVLGLLGKLFKMKSSVEFPGSAILMSGNRIATIEARDGLFLFDLDGGEAQFRADVPTRGFAIDLVASGDLLYLANGHDGVRIGRVHGDGTVDWIGHLQTVEARDVSISGDTLIVADGGDGLKVVDVSDPRNPRILGAHRSPFFLSAVVTRGQRAYIAGGLGGAEIVDFSNPTHPRLAWREKLSEVRGVDVGGRFLYVPDGYEGLRIYSLAGGEPSIASVLDTPGWCCDVFVSGDRAYLADGGQGIEVADISERDSPALIGSVYLESLTREIHLRGETLFAAAHTKGVFAIDVSRPADPSIAHVYPTVDDARGVFADERFVYLASGSGGVYIFTYKR